MAQKKIITIIGATGAQGGGLARAILRDKNSGYAVRAFTRTPESDKARELEKLGAQIVKGDIDDPETLKAAFADAHGAYLLTFFWSHFSPEKEIVQARNMAAAAREAGLKHVIWSTLEDTRKYIPLEDDRMPTLQGKYKVPHFDGKGEADSIFSDLDVPTTYLLASFYWENFIYFGMGPRKNTAGGLTLSLPIGGTKMAGIGAEDIGKCAFGIFIRGAEMIGKRIGVAGDQLSGIEMAQAISKTLGRPVDYRSINPEDYRKLGFPGADDLGNMFQFYRDFDNVCNSMRSVKASSDLNPELKSFSQWLEENANSIPLD